MPHKWHNLEYWLERSGIGTTEYGQYFMCSKYQNYLWVYFHFWQKQIFLFSSRYFYLLCITFNSYVHFNPQNTEEKHISVKVYEQFYMICNFWYLFVLTYKFQVSFHWCHVLNLMVIQYIISISSPRCFTTLFQFTFLWEISNWSRVSFHFCLVHCIFYVVFRFVHAIVKMTVMQTRCKFCSSFSTRSLIGCSLPPHFLGNVSCNTESHQLGHSCSTCNTKITHRKASQRS